MSPLKLPEHPSLEFLKKVAKQRLRALRAKDANAQLAQAQLQVAREYGFASWRALKAEVDRRRAPQITAFFRAAEAGDVERVRELLQHDASLVQERTTGERTALHVSVEHPEVVFLLLQHGADPNAREKGDNVTPLHLAAANKVLESVRLLLDAGADVHGHGDLHNGDVIGWATAEDNQAVIDVLLEHGARHHIFSAMALRDRALVQKVVEENPGALERRRSRFENGQTPVHAAFVPPDGLGYLAGQPDYEMLQLLIDLGADVDAPDDKGRTPLGLARLRGDEEAVRILRAAGAQEPTEGQGSAGGTQARFAPDHAKSLAQSVKKSTPMFGVPDMRATVAWYESIGFTVDDTYEDSGQLTWAQISFGPAEFALTGSGRAPRQVSLWFFTDRVNELYEFFKARQAQPDLPPLRFDEDLYEPFYGGRQFSLKDLNDLPLIFWQPATLKTADGG
jgi:ankyrin repeat protein